MGASRIQHFTMCQLRPPMSATIANGQRPPSLEHHQESQCPSVADSNGTLATLRVPAVTSIVHVAYSLASPCITSRITRHQLAPPRQFFQTRCEYRVL